MSSLSAPLFTVSLNHLNPDDFGLIEHTKYTGELSFHPSLPPPVNQSWWVVNATSRSVGSKAPSHGGFKAIVDTGASFILLPQKYVDVYYKNAPYVNNDPYDGYTFPCNNTLQDLTLLVGCCETTIPGKLMVGASVKEISKHFLHEVWLFWLTMHRQLAIQLSPLPFQMNTVPMLSLVIASSRRPHSLQTPARRQISLGFTEKWSL